MRFIIAPGNGGCGRSTASTNWYGWLDEELKKKGHESTQQGDLQSRTQQRVSNGTW